MPGSLDGDTIREALRMLGQRLRVDRDVELTVVGSAAGLLTGTLPGAVTTGDVDVLPLKEIEALLEAAAEVQRTMLLPPAWLNDFAGLWYHALPDGWEERRIRTGRFARLEVFAIDRLDQIAMKFFAHRVPDLEHLSLMNLSDADLEFIRRYLGSLAGRWPEEGARIELALSILDRWPKRAP